jgi:hypothetical protein
VVVVPLVWWFDWRHRQSDPARQALKVHKAWRLWIAPEAGRISGGCNGDVRVVVTGFETHPISTKKFMLRFGLLEHTGLDASIDPALILDSDFEITAGQLACRLKMR